MNRFSYLLTGIGLAAVLVVVIFVARLTRPGLPASAPNFSRAQGPASARIQIIEYSDFECPACEAAQEVLRKILALHQDQVRLVYRHFPLEGHRWSALAHHAAECAAQQQAFWPYHDRLYQEQGTWSRGKDSPLEAFLTYAKELRLDLDLFARCLADPEVDKKIQSEQSEGSSLGVRSTPSFFVNGKFVIGAEEVRREVEELLSPPSST